jgi:GWxTD domain-containing protein
MTGLGSPIMIEAFPRVSSDSAHSAVSIHFRIDAGFFVPVREQGRGTSAPFVRRGEILLELIDSTGVSRVREITRLERGSAEGERPRPGTDWFQGCVTFTVPFGTYSLLVEVTDAESRRSTTDRSRRVAVLPPVRRAGDDAPSLFMNTRPPGQGPETLRVHNFGGDVLFGSPVSLYAEFPRGALPQSPTDVVLTYEMIPPGDEVGVVVRTDTAAGRPISSPAATSCGSDTLGIAYVVRARDSVDVILVPLETARLPLRRYRLTAVFEGPSGPVAIRRTFRMVWPDMPRSLRNVDEALAALRYVAPESAIDSLLEGPLETRWANLEAFWKPRDRSPETAPNEVATEYYRRVDHARESFGTLRQPDGFRTDRGRIYVLHGPPTATDRTLDPAEGFREVWTYARGNKRFIFVDRTKTGDYILVQPATQ